MSGLVVAAVLAVIAIIVAGAMGLRTWFRAAEAEVQASQRERQARIEQSEREDAERLARYTAIRKLGSALADVVPGSADEAHLLRALDALQPSEADLRDCILVAERSGGGDRVRQLLTSRVVEAVTREVAPTLPQ